MGHWIRLELFSAFPRFLTADGAVHETYAETRTTLTSTPTVFTTPRFWRYTTADRRLRLPNGLECFYDQQGRLVEVKDPFSNRLAITWNGSTLSQVQQILGDGDMRTVTWTWNNNIMTMAVDDRTWTYGENGSGSMRPPVGPGWKTEYSPVSQRLAAIETPSGGRIEYDYELRHFVNPWGGTAAINTWVLKTRTVKAQRSVPEAVWNFEYSASFGQENTVSGPLGIEYTFQYLMGPSGEAVESMVPHFQESRENGTVVETVSHGQFIPHPTNEWSRRSVTNLPTSITTTRDGREYRQSFDYGEFGVHFHNYGRPTKQTETGDAGTRTTEWTYDYDFDRYILDRVASETVKVGADAVATSWSYEHATGFRESETVYGVTTTFVPVAETGALQAAIDAHGHQTTFTHAWGVVKNTTTPEYAIVRSINTDGTIATETRRGFTTRYEYDQLGRIEWVKPRWVTGSRPAMTMTAARG